MTIDAWMQHPTPRFLAGDMFASLRRGMGARRVFVKLADEAQ